MPTFNDAHADAREAAEAVRGLAHATQHVENPDVLYPVVGELMATTRRLSQVLDHLARALFTRITIDDEENATYTPDKTTASVLAHTGINAPAQLTAETKLPRHQAGQFRLSNLTWS